MFIPIRRAARVRCACSALALTWLPLTAIAADPQVRFEELEKRIERLEASAEIEPVPAAPAQPFAPAAHPFQVGLNALFAFGGSSEDDDVLANLQAGGHDPSRNGFTVQNVELVFSGTVDPYFDAQANVIFLIDRDGETVLELEEAFLATRALPAGLQVKTGQYYTEFGRQNQQHPHAWAFVDQPIVLSRFFGPDNLRSQGARVAWLTPLPWYSELYLGAQNARGETLTSFLFVEGETVGNHTLIDRGGARSLEDLLWSSRWLNGFDLSDTASVNAGVSGLWGPNAAGIDTDTRIYGVDLYLKWRPLRHERGFPFVAWQSEVMWRDYEAPGETLRDRGAYTQVLWGYAPGWVAGARAEYANANSADPADPLRDKRTRYSVNLTRYFSEYSKVRLQYNRDEAEHLDGKTANALWLQYEVGIGRHAAHTF